MKNESSVLSVKDQNNAGITEEIFEQEKKKKNKQGKETFFIKSIFQPLPFP